MLLGLTLQLTSNPDILHYIYRSTTFVLLVTHNHKTVPWFVSFFCKCVGVYCKLH